MYTDNFFLTSTDSTCSGCFCLSNVRNFSRFINNMDIPQGVLDLLKKVKKSSLADFDINLTTNTKGQGFIGDVVFVTLTNKKSQKQEFLTLKQQKTENGKPLEWSNEPFENEIYFYNTIWLTLEEMYKTKTGNSLDIVPKCLGTLDDGVKRLAMENLKLNGFDINESSKIFSRDQIKLMLKSYGIFHALSMVLKELHPDKFSEFTSNIHNEWLKMDLIGRGVVQTAEEVRSFFDPVKDKHLLDCLLKYSGQEGLELYYNSPNKDALPRTITHADCWSNNLMFKYDVSISIIYSLVFECLMKTKYLQ